MLTDPAAIIERVSQKLSSFRSVCCLTGAGVSAESGVPTFRGPGGLWQGRRAEDLATPQAFQRDPETVWKFYNYRREKLLHCEPNAGHTAIAALEAAFDDWTVITQNVDGLHRQAGSKNIVELHGNIWTTRCTACGHEFDRFGDNLGKLPACDDCGGLLRPGVVWFGEMLPPTALAAAQDAVGRCQAIFVVGTSSVVEPAASMAGWARAHGALVVEINLEPTPLSEEADDCIFGKAGEILPLLASAVAARKSDQSQ